MYNNKIYNKIETLIINSILSKNGKDSLQNYRTLVDDIIGNDQYHIFTSVLLNKWNIDSKKYVNIDILIKESHGLIIKLLPSDEQKRIKELFDSYNLYQNGIEIYYNDSNVLIGKLHEVNISEYYEYYNDLGFLEKNKILTRAIQVDKNDNEVMFSDTETDIYEKYDQALQYLLEN